MSKFALQIKRTLLFLLVLMLISSNMIYAEAANGLFISEAKALQELGLLKSSNDSFELERQPNRLEISIMLVRMLGKEQEATNKTLKHSFTDVPSWANSYVGYLYANKYTKGVSAKAFGSNIPADANSYVTYLLRALGYNDGAGDFKWNSAIDKGVSVGLIDAEYAAYLKSASLFQRNDMIKLSYDAIKCKIKNSQDLLLDKLLEQKAIDGVKVMQLFDHIPKDYVRINNINELFDIRNNLKGKYILMKDLDFNNINDYKDKTSMTVFTAGNGWLPIGHDTGNIDLYTFEGNMFEGVFNGNDHSISNLYINNENQCFVGLFGNLSIKAQISNLHLKDVSIQGKYYAGALSGWSESEITNCTSSGTVYGIRHIGGLTGSNCGKIRHSSSSATVNSSSTVASLDSRAGGLAGNNLRSGVIEQCYSTGEVNAFNNLGGLIGMNWGKVANCYSTSAVNIISKAHNYTGGLIGTLEEGTIQNCYAAGTVNGAAGTGGLLGANFGGTILNCIAMNENITGIGRVSRSIGINDHDIPHDYKDDDIGVYHTYANIDMKISMSSNQNNPTIWGKDITSENVQSKQFFETSSNWNTEKGTLWDFTNLWEFKEAGSLPTLKSLSNTK